MQFTRRHLIMKASAGDIVLLPRPKQISKGQGHLLLKSGDCISIDPTDKDQLLPIAQKIQCELDELIGVRLSIVVGDRSVSKKVVRFVRVDGMADQGYTLAISEECILIRYSLPAGAFYATRTLKQIVRQTGKCIPSLEIQDEPDLPTRGHMLDISRDKIPTMETLYRIVDLMSDLKLNHLELYIEGASFAYPSYPFMWESETPITGEEILSLDRYCKDRFVDLVPNQNSFGHMAQWLTDKRLNHLAECPDGFEFEWGRMSAFTLNPLDPGSIELVADLYDDLLPYFSSDLFNVGCDETFELGKGKSKEACEEKGVGRVYLEYLLKIHKLVSERGKKMMFWGDIIANHPDLVPELPKDIIALEWGYEKDHPFESRCKMFKDAGVDFYVCPGTSAWNSIAGRTDNMKQNIYSAASNGIATGALGLLNTDWGDNGHWQYLPVSYAGMMYGAAVSWACEENRDVDLATCLDKLIFLDANGVMGKFALDLGNYYLLQGKRTPNTTVIFSILNSGLTDNRCLHDVTCESLQKTRAYVDELEQRLATACMKCDDADLIEEEFKNAIRFIRHGADLGLVKMDIAESDSDGASKEAKDQIKAKLLQLEDDIRRLTKKHRQLWLKRNRVGGLDRSTRQLERLLEQYRHFK